MKRKGEGRGIRKFLMGLHPLCEKQPVARVDDSHLFVIRF
jgi:hypothetical protein